MKKTSIFMILSAFLCLVVAVPGITGQNRKAGNDIKTAMAGIRAGDKAIVRLGSDIEIKEGTTLKSDVVCLFGTIQLNGRIDGSAVSMFGKIKAGKNAAVTKDLVLLMSEVEPADGVKAGGSFVEINPPGQAFMVKIMKFWLKSLPVNILISLISLIVLIWLFIRFVIPAIDPQVLTRNLTTNAGKAFLYGLLGIIAVDVTGLVLFMTMILSGTGLVVFGFLGLLWLIGYIPVAFWLGEKVAGLFKAKFSSIGQVLSGIIVIIVVMCVPVIGTLTISILGVIGFGVLISQILKLKLAAK